MELLSCWHFKEGVGTVMRVRLSIVACGNKDLGSEPRMIAVVPGDKTEVAEYLEKLGVLVDGIVNVSLSDIHVSATPTVFLVDRSGRVSNVWVGKLDVSRENEVIQRVSNSH